MSTEELARSMDDIKGKYNIGQLDLDQLIKAAVDLGRMYEKALKKT